MIQRCMISQLLQLTCIAILFALELAKTIQQLITRAKIHDIYTETHARKLPLAIVAVDA
jgi:hypothetical protein